MSPKHHTNTYLAVGCIAFALVVAFVWVPLDTDTGLIEKVRRRVSIGDALAPTIAAFAIGLGGLLLAFERAKDDGAISLGNLRYLGVVLAGLVISFAVMRWAGPLAVMLTGAETEYRVLRDTAPWKFIGFFLGCTGMIAGLFSLIDGRVTIKALIVAAVATIVLILLFDVPFEDLILPPNGDV